MTVFDFIALMGMFALLCVFIFTERKAVKERDRKYFEDLTESIITGVHIGMERWSICEREYARHRDCAKHEDTPQCPHEREYEGVNE